MSTVILHNITVLTFMERINEALHIPAKMPLAISGMNGYKQMCLIV